MKIAIEPVYDRYGGMYPYISGIKKFSAHKVKEVPSAFTRVFLNRNRWLKLRYKEFKSRAGLGAYDVVHSMSYPWFMNLGYISRSAGCKWVHTYHIIFFEEDYIGGLKPWQKEVNSAQTGLASKADVRISTSKWVHDYLLEEYSIETEIVMGGIDVELCQKANAERFVKKHGLSDFVLFVGSIREHKNPRLFMELASRMPGVNFVMIGPGLNEKKARESFSISLPQNLVLMDKIERTDVLDAMSACRVYVLTSKHEGFPQSVLEAMAIGKPVVISAYRGSEELVPSDEYGFLFKMDSIEELVDGTKEALESQSAGKNAQQRVIANYSWKKLIGRIDELYES